MFSTEDTIVAVATPPGRGGIGVVRISGPRAAIVAKEILKKPAGLQPRHVTLARVFTESGATLIDHVLATYFPQPESYTGEDVVEISGHGNPVLLHQIVAAAGEAGARLAEPGEFTLRAFLTGRLDLIQAEAVGDLIDAVTPLQARVAFDQLDGTMTSAISDIERGLFDLVARLEASIDFPDEGYHFVDATAVTTKTQDLANRVEQLLSDARRGRMVREGCQVVILGKPNVGKSTLFNCLLGTPRAIVADTEGTTRDLLTEVLDLDGIPVTLIDTAGIRHAQDVVETEGVNRARAALNTASLVVLMLDQSRSLDTEDEALLTETSTTTRVVVASKSDLPTKWTKRDLIKGKFLAHSSEAVIPVSLLGDYNLADLRCRLREVLWGKEPLRDTPAVSNLRHAGLLERAKVSLRRAMEASAAAKAEELVLADLYEACAALEEITGRRTSDDVLHRIFEQFCVGK